MYHFTAHDEDTCFHAKLKTSVIEVLKEGVVTQDEKGEKTIMNADHILIFSFLQLIYQ